MSILARFTGAPSLTSADYDRTLGEIEASGEWPPRGMEYHVAFTAPDGSFRVSEIWDSMADFEAFGERLMPILAANGIELAGPPELLEVHNVIKR